MSDNDIQVEPEVAATFRRTESGFTSHISAAYIESITSPPHWIASIASSRVPVGSVALPQGYDAEVLETIMAVTGTVGVDVNISVRQAGELAEIGRQILELDCAGNVWPPLYPYEKQSIAHLVDLVDREGQS